MWTFNSLCATMQTLNNYEFLVILIYNAYNASSLKLMNSGRYVILEGAIKKIGDFEVTLFKLVHVLLYDIFVRYFGMTSQ